MIRSTLNSYQNYTFSTSAGSATVACTPSIEPHLGVDPRRRGARFEPSRWGTSTTRRILENRDYWNPAHYPAEARGPAGGAAAWDKLSKP